MTRSKWKGPFVLPLNSIQELKTPKIWARHSVIPSSFLGKTVLIHNGNTFKKVLITKEKIGYKFGEFSLTRQFSLKKKVLPKSKKKK